MATCGCGRAADACHGAKSSVCVCACGGGCHGGRHGRAGTALSVSPERIVLAQMVMQVRRSRGGRRPKFSAPSWRQRLKRIGFGFIGGSWTHQPSFDPAKNELFDEIERLIQHYETENHGGREPRLSGTLRAEIDVIIGEITREGKVDE